MFCGCQGIDSLGQNDVSKLTGLNIILKEDANDDSGGPHTVLEAMLGAFAYRSLFFGGFAYFAIDFLFTPTWFFSPYYTLAMSLSFCCSVIIITISLLYTVQSSRMQTNACRNLFASKMVWPVRIAYAMFLHALFWQLIGFIVIGRIKDFDYSGFAEPDPAIDYQFQFDLGIPGFICLVAAVVTRIVVTNQATSIIEWERDCGSLALFEDDAEPSHETRNRVQHSTTDNCERMLKRMDASANAASFCAGNVFYEVLFSSMGKEGAVDFPGGMDKTWTKLTNHWYFTFSGITFMLGTTVVIISTIVTVWAHALQGAESKRLFARKMHLLSVLCAKLFTCSQIAWLLAVAAMGVVKWSPELPKKQFIWVSVRWAALGLALMLYHFKWIKDLRKKVNRSVGDKNSTTTRRVHWSPPTVAGLSSG
eukprot:SAG11_NODE_3749_length_2251_cov_2.012082_1_plen_421_part_00